MRNRLKAALVALLVVLGYQTTALGHIVDSRGVSAQAKGIGEAGVYAAGGRLRPVAFDGGIADFSGGSFEVADTACIGPATCSNTLPGVYALDVNVVSGASQLPFAGGATSVPNAPNQGVAIFGQNPSGSNDYIGENGNAMYVAVSQGSNGTNPAMQRACDHHAQLNSAGALTTQVVAPVTGHQIGLCGYSMSASGVNSMKIVEGTHTTNDCDTGQTDVVTTQYSSGVGWGKTVLQPYVAMNSSSNTWLLPVNTQLCLTSTQTVPWTLEVWYAII